MQNGVMVELLSLSLHHKKIHVYITMPQVQFAHSTALFNLHISAFLEWFDFVIETNT